MKGVSNESTNTDKMRQHQLTKTRVSSDSLRHEDVDLMVCTDLIDQTRTEALNSSSENATLLEVLSANPEDKALASDVDQQLLLKVIFKEKVNISAVSLRFNRPPIPTEGEDEDMETYAKPRLVKIFVNKQDILFNDVEEYEPAAKVVIEGEDDLEARITCVGHRFQRLDSLIIFVEEAADPEAERSFVNRVSVIGHQAQSYHAEYM